jgi:hypothetical protein
MNIIEDPKVPTEQALVIRIYDLCQLIQEVYDVDEFGVTSTIRHMAFPINVTGHAVPADVEELVQRGEADTKEDSIQIIMDDLAAMGYLQKGLYMVLS